MGDPNQTKDAAKRPRSSGLIRIHPRDLPPKDRKDLRRQAVETEHTALQIHDIFIDRGYAMNLEALRKSIARERRKARLAPRKPGRPRKTPLAAVEATVAGDAGAATKPDDRRVTAVFAVLHGGAAELDQAIRTVLQQAGLLWGGTRL